MEEKKFRFLIIALSGILAGLAPIILKLSGDIVSMHTAAAVLAMIFSFLLLQKALHCEKISIVIPVYTAINIFIVFILSVALFSETISYIKWFGVSAIVLGTFDLIRE